MGRIRVLVVDDSVTVRQRLIEVLAADAELEVVGDANDGEGAIALCNRLRPDVVTMDMAMPRVSGPAAVEHIMAYCPTPILIVSSSVNRGEAFKTFDALAAGAVEVVEKPAGDVTDEAWEKKLRATVKLVSRIRVMTHLRGRRPSRTLAGMERSVAAARPTDGARTVAIGASTGGPAALVDILGALPADFPLPILLVVHLSPMFATPFVEWLERHSRLRVAYAQDGEPIPQVGQARVLLAPPDRHLEVEGARLRLTRAAERHSCRPSVDVLFESLARTMGDRTIGCLLTGMGRDGAEGLLAIRRAGGVTLAQDEASSVIFGMPGEAVRLGAAQRVVPLERIGLTLVELSSGPMPEGGPHVPEPEGREF